jgi:predicted DCC family thiol-disulfide oxidoreductase YuxK
MTDPLQLNGRLLVVFDGHCGLCNRSVRWFLVRDRRDQLRFTPSQSEPVADLLARHGLSTNDALTGPTSILVVRNAGSLSEQVHLRSRAVLAILAELPRPWPVIAAVLRWIPRPLLDLAYRVVARWRYRIWGRLDTCPVPTPEERARFL